MGEFGRFLFNSVIKVFLINLWVVVVLIVRNERTHSDNVMLCDFVMLHVISNATLYAIKEFYAV